MRTLHFAFAASLCFGALTACSSSIEIGSDDGGTLRDGGRTRTDAEVGEPCGANTCTDGEYCCNASCGICAPEGAACTTIACPEPVVCNGNVCEAEGATCCPGCAPGESHCSANGGACPPLECPGEPCGDTTCGAGEQCCPAGCPGMSDFCSDGDTMCPIPGCPAPTCDPFQAWGSGPCDAVLGVRWNGSYCESLSGCSCVGADCGRLYETQDDCESYHSGSCPGGQAGCSADLDCPDSMWCHGCAHGSCPVCADCVADCAPNPCESEPEPSCDEPRPECGEGGVAIVRDGCWLCVDPYGCEPIDPTDCRLTGCSGDQTCQPCWASHQCLPPGAVC